MALPYTFTNGTVADADEVNSNFDAVNSLGIYGGGLYYSSSISYNVNTYVPVNGISVPHATEDYMKIVVPVSGVLKNFYVDVITNSLDGTMSFTIRKNGVNTDLEVTYSSSETGVKSDTSNTVSVSAGDVLSIRINTGGSTSGSASKINWGLQIIK